MGIVAGLRKGLCVSIFNRYISSIWSEPDTTKEESMNAPNDIEMKTEEVLRVELAVFRREHLDLDSAIRALQETGRADQITLQRLKKKKLALKDKIARIEDRLTPDIIA